MTFLIIAFSVCITICIASGAYVCILIYEELVDSHNEDTQPKEEYVKKSDIVYMYEHDFPDLDDEVHWSRHDILHNLNSIPSYYMSPVEEDKE